MRTCLRRRTAALISAALLGSTSITVAQPAASPLGVQGMDQLVMPGVRSLGMGATGIASVKDASALFSNPAGLSQLSAFEIRAGGSFRTTSQQQSQDWVPMRPVPGLSVLFESMTGTIKEPDSLGIPGLPLSKWSKLQEQYDDILPDWSRSSSTVQPFTLAAAIPAAFEGIHFSAGIGVSRVIDLEQYYQNNNSMSPYLGQERPAQQFFENRNDTVHVKWYQYVRSREGSIYGITPGVSVTLLPGLSIGGSASFLTGSSDDTEKRVERGHLNIAVSNGVPANFMLDTVYYYQTQAGTSTYSGTKMALGVLLQQERYNIGLTVNPPMTVTRSWDRTVTSLDTTNNTFPVRVDSLTARTYSESGKDELRFPFSVALGIVLKPGEEWTIAFDYLWRNLAGAELTSQPGGGSTNPWVSNKGAMRLGAEYRPEDFLALRAGYRQDLQAFSPDGSPIIDEPASGEVYSAGAGLTLGSILIDLAYEYARLEYEDIYQSNFNFNTREQHRVYMEVAFRL